MVPHKCRAEIHKLAHNNPLAGHVGVNNTYDQIFRCFFGRVKGEIQLHC